MRCFAFAVLASFGWCPESVLSDVFRAPPADVDVVGVIRTKIAKEDESLLDLARRHDLGRDELFIANPELPHWVSIAGQQVVLPTRFILPADTRRGLIINLPEKRLYWFNRLNGPYDDLVYTYPVSIGQRDWTTPLGVTRIVARRENPSWYPPDSILQEAEAKGRPLPRIVPSGPANPLGAHALYLDLPSYLIHGTNNPLAIGMRVTHGCIRMYPEDVASVFRLVPTGTPVTIVDEPVKVGWHAGILYLEVHPPLEESELADDDLLVLAARLVKRATFGKPTTKVLSHIVRRAAVRQDGMPVAVTRLVTHAPD